MQTLTNPGHGEPGQPDAIRVAHDVNQAIFDLLTPTPVKPETYDLSLVPGRHWTATEAGWDEQLTQIFQAVRRKYPVLNARPSPEDVSATLMLPMSTTHQLIVGRIFSPAFRPAGRHGAEQAYYHRPEDRCSRLGRHPEDAPSLSRLQVDFEVQRAIVETLVPRRIAEDE